MLKGLWPQDPFLSFSGMTLSVGSSDS